MWSGLEAVCWCVSTSEHPLTEMTGDWCIQPDIPRLVPVLNWCGGGGRWRGGVFENWKLRIVAMYACLIMFDHVWSCLIMFDHVWSCLIMFDHVWSWTCAFLGQQSPPLLDLARSLSGMTGPASTTPASLKKALYEPAASAVSKKSKRDGLVS